MRRRFGWLSVASITLGVVAIGCSAPAVTLLPSVGALDACAAAPRMDEIVGRVSVSEPSGYAVGPLARCTWTYMLDPSRFVGLTVAPAHSHDDAIAAFGEGEAVEALGDDARWWPGAATLSVKAGDRSFQVDLLLDDPDVSLELAEAVAREVLANLS